MSPCDYRLAMIAVVGLTAAVAVLATDGDRGGRAVAG
jgi:hypothetical protein